MSYYLIFIPALSGTSVSRVFLGEIITSHIFCPSTAYFLVLTFHAITNSKTPTRLRRNEDKEIHRSFCLGSLRLQAEHEI